MHVCIAPNACLAPSYHVSAGPLEDELVLLSNEPPLQLFKFCVCLVLVCLFFVLKVQFLRIKGGSSASTRSLMWQ